MFGLANFYVSPLYLSFYRVIFCLIFVTFIGLPAYTWIAFAPDYLFYPPPMSVANLFSGFPGVSFFMVVTLANVISFILMFLGLWPKTASILFSLSAIVGHSFSYSFGKVDHVLLWFIAPVFLAFAGWGEYFSIEHLMKREIRPEPSYDQVNSFWILLFAVTIAFTMFTAGIQKIWGGWLLLDTNPSKYHILRHFLAGDKQELLASYVLHIDSRLFWKVQDYATVILEIGFIFSLFRISAFRTFLVVATFFHIVVLLMLNIPFFSNPIVYLIFLNWDRFNLNKQIDQMAMRYVSNVSVRIVFVLIPLFVFVYWVALAFSDKSLIVLPGLVQTLLTAAGVVNAGSWAMYLFFIVVFLAILATLYRYFKQPGRLSKNIKDLPINSGTL